MGSEMTAPQRTAVDRKGNKTKLLHCGCSGSHGVWGDGGLASLGALLLCIRVKRADKPHLFRFYPGLAGAAGANQSCLPPTERLSPVTKKKSRVGLKTGTSSSIEETFSSSRWPLVHVSPGFCERPHSQLWVCDTAILTLL